MPSPSQSPPGRQLFLELKLVVSVSEEAGATSDEEFGATSEEDAGVSLEAGAGASLPLDAGESWLDSLDVGATFPLDAGVSLSLESGSWTELISLTGDTLVLSSLQAVSMKATIEAAARPQAVPVIFFFMILLLYSKLYLPSRQWYAHPVSYTHSSSVSVHSAPRRGLAEQSFLAMARLSLSSQVPSSHS
jgi:hypothetical protein